MKEYVKEPFNLKLALQGNKVATRNDQCARIVCTDRSSTDDRPLVALVTQRNEEELRSYRLDGTCNSPSKQLFMLVERQVDKVDINDIAYLERRVAQLKIRQSQQQKTIQVDKVDINDTASLERRIEQLKIKQAQHAETIKDDLRSFQHHQSAFRARLKVASYEGWQRLGTPVRRGEVAHDIDGAKVFHVTQTTQFGL